MWECVRRRENASKLASDVRRNSRWGRDWTRHELARGGWSKESFLKNLNSIDSFSPEFLVNTPANDILPSRLLLVFHCCACAAVSAWAATCITICLWTQSLCAGMQLRVRCPNPTPLHNLSRLQRRLCCIHSRRNHTVRRRDVEFWTSICSRSYRAHLHH